jgi:hypothetical protein
MFYLKHRFSNDLDFFSVRYNEKDIEELVRLFEEEIGYKIELDSELRTENRARVKFYIADIKRGIPFKMDFIEDVFFINPKIRKFNGISVYDVGHIYYQKVMAIAGTYLITDETGRERQTGRNAAKDVYDLYCLSKEVIPIHKYLKGMKGEQQRGMITWYRSFSRQDLKLNILDLDIYDRSFDSSEMIRYIDAEIEKFIREIMP